MSFEAIFDEKVTGKWKVVEKETGWFYPNLTQLEAEHLCEKLNETNKKEIESSRRIRTIPFSENQIHDDFIEWDYLITWLHETGETFK